MITTRLLCWLTLLVTFAMMVGCGDPVGKLYPVAGTVTVDGKPLTTGAVTLRPDADNPTMHYPTGQIDSEGRYQLFTANRQGAPPGNYKVLVIAQDMGKDGYLKKENAPANPKWLVNPKYTDPTTTDLSIAVVPQPAEGAYDLKLTK